MDNLFIKPIAITAAFVALQTHSFYAPVSSEQQVNNQRIHNINAYITPIKIDPALDIKERIKRFQFLQDGWDGYGASKPDYRVINNSMKFINCLPETIVGALIIDDVVATPYGTLVFDWKNGDDVLSVEIGETSLGFFSDINENSSLQLSSTKFNESELPDQLHLAFKNFFRSVNA